MRLKDIDNPWLVVRLPLLLGTFGLITGVATAPMFVQLFNPSVGMQDGVSLDAYSQHHADWYKNGAIIGLIIGVGIALITLYLLKKHEEEEASSDQHEAHAAH